MIFDSDVMIWCRRGDAKAEQLVQVSERLCVSAQTYMELLQGARDLRTLKASQVFLRVLGFEVLPITPNISHRAIALIEEYAHSSGLRAGDALIAATALEHGLPLATANVKHFKVVKNLEIHPFKPLGPSGSGVVAEAKPVYGAFPKTKLRPKARAGKHSS